MLRKEEHMKSRLSPCKALLPAVALSHTRVFAGMMELICTVAGGSLLATALRILLQSP